MQRSGLAHQSGLIFVLNNRGTWNGAWVQTPWNSRRLVPAAWRGRDDSGVPQENGLTTPAGPIFGHHREAMQCTCLHNAPRMTNAAMHTWKYAAYALNYTGVRECISRPNFG